MTQKRKWESKQPMEGGGISHPRKFLSKRKRGRGGGVRFERPDFFYVFVPYHWSIDKWIPWTVYDLGIASIFSHGFSKKMEGWPFWCKSMISLQIVIAPISTVLTYPSSCLPEHSLGDLRMVMSRTQLKKFTIYRQQHWLWLKREPQNFFFEKPVSCEWVWWAWDSLFSRPMGTVYKWKVALKKEHYTTKEPMDHWIYQTLSGNCKWCQFSADLGKSYD